MKNIDEIKKSIELLIAYPHTFGFSDFSDRGNPCTGRLDRMDKADTENYAQTYAAVLQAMPKYSDLHQRFAPELAKELGIEQYPRYDYTVKLLTRIFEDDEQIKDSSVVEQMCLFTAHVQRYMKNTGKTELTAEDMKNII